MIDKHSDTWRNVAAWADVELDKACERIEMFGLSSEETASLRGQIHILRNLLAMQDKAEKRVIGEVQDYGFQNADTD